MSVCLFLKNVSCNHLGDTPELGTFKEDEAGEDLQDAEPASEHTKSKHLILLTDHGFPTLGKVQTINILFMLTRVFFKSFLTGWISAYGNMWQEITKHSPVLCCKLKISYFK